ncbi:MAG: helix-turn-helix domain-containing protein [Patescibacteria group bacterium]
MQPKLLTVNDVAKSLAISKMTVYRYIKSKKLCAYKLEQELRIKEADLQNFLEERKTKK